MGPLKLAKMARQARKQWSELPPRERETLRGEADKVRDLAKELSRIAARRDASTTGSPRQRTVQEVTSELTSAISALSRAVAPGAAVVLKDNTPRSVRLGTRALKFGSHYAAGRMARSRARPAVDDATGNGSLDAAMPVDPRK
jgi:hypothetical protein